MRQNEEILEKLKKEGEELPVPKSLTPEKMRDTLKVYEGMKKRSKRRRAASMLGAAACFLLTFGVVLGLTGRISGNESGLQPPLYGETASDASARENLPEDAEDETERSSVGIPVMTYEEIYEQLSGIWDEQDEYASGAKEAAAESAAAVSDLRKLQRAEASDHAAAEAAYGTTNVQVESVDEADRIKNDGRYLYQIAWKSPDPEDGGQAAWGIQILDTKDGLSETAFLCDFNRIEEFYVWEDLLITIEDKYMVLTENMDSFSDGAAKSRLLADLSSENAYHEISVYDIADRSEPKKIRTFTLQGGYESSRISDGYFYGISQFTARARGGVNNRASYIPTLDGQVLEEKRVYCPADSEGTSYLVLVSIDLKNPSEFADSRAVLCGSGTYYVSPENIYVGEYHSVYEGDELCEGAVSDRTDILKFSYKKGKISVHSRGEIPGKLDGSFSLDEYNGYLRAVTTVEEYQVKKVTDDRTEEELGYEFGSRRQTNGLYVLDPGLRVIGTIEGLAENEEIYSARFLGDQAYFVTFRQTDPLFAVDLSDPSDPKILGELKVTGFSEYLHPWSGNLLLGIGKEADADTGAAQCMKLSMFDLSDPEKITEAGKLLLENYDYSEVLTDHREVLADEPKNLIGFTASGTKNGQFRQDYVLYSYEDGAFVQKLQVDTYDEDGYYTTRGTYIGDVLYLLKENGTARAYDLNSGALLAEL